MVAELATAAVMLSVALAEMMHGRRCRRIAALAFGPAEEPRRWTRAVPVFRVLCLGALAWGLTTLFLIEPRVFKARELPAGELRHVVIIMDVSPSMKLTDAGPEGRDTRTKRANEIISSLLERIIIEQARISVVAVYTGARPVVVDCKDPEVIRNILNDLPMEYAFDIGKTDLLSGIEEAAALAKKWRKGSTTFVVVSDGDTVSETGMPDLPPSVADVLVVGVGSSSGGIFIDGHQSRQDSATLRQIARRLGGFYHDGNERHLPSEKLASLAASLPLRREGVLGRRELAMLLVLLGGLVCAGIPVALAAAGSRWRAVAVHTGKTTE